MWGQVRSTAGPSNLRHSSSYVVVGPGKQQRLYGSAPALAGITVRQQHICNVHAGSKMQSENSDGMPGAGHCKGRTTLTVHLF